MPFLRPEPVLTNVELNVLCRVRKTLQPSRVLVIDLSVRCLWC